MSRPATQPDHDRGSDPEARVGRWAWILPFLVALLSVTILAAENADSGIRPGDLVVPLGLALLVALTAWVAGGILCLRLGTGRGVLAAWMTAAVLFGGRVADLVGTGSSVWPEMAIGFALLLVPTILLKRLPPRLFPGLGRFLLLACLFLLGANVAGMRSLLWESRVAHPASAATADAAELPDIYFILLDAYSGPRSLREVYGLDITPVQDSLAALGFEVVREGYANYTATFLALAAMLDWDYPSEILSGKGPKDEDRGELYRLLHENATTRFVKDLGYEITFYRSPYPPLRSSPMADVHVPARVVGQFPRLWFKQTLLLRAAQTLCHIVQCATNHPQPFEPGAANDRESIFGSLADVQTSRSPRFHYAHVLLPHEPFLFRASCEHRARPYWPSDMSPQTDSLARAIYADQVRCTNHLLLDALTAIVRAPGPSPVIIVQSDHGYARFPDGRPISLHRADEQRVRERLDVFGAYHVPGASGPIVYPGITPVNAMRAVFREAFDLELARLPDLTYWSSFERPYEFTPVRADSLWGSVDPDRMVAEDGG